MPRASLDNEISQLKNEVLILGSMVEQSMHSAVAALKKGDLVSAQTIYNSDKEVNDKTICRGKCHYHPDRHPATHGA